MGGRMGRIAGGWLGLWIWVGFFGMAEASGREPLRVGGKRIVAEIADTPYERAKGLMGRGRLSDSEGMLFVFGAPGRHCFWMKGTPEPLAIAWADARGRIAGLAEMEAFSLREHCPREAALYALEMRRGWFADHGVGIGDRLEGGPIRAKAWRGSR